MDTAIDSQAKSGIFRVIFSPDVQFAMGLVGVIFTMILPLAPFVLDFLLSMSITFGFLILLVAIYVQDPLDFSTFPTILLVTTLFRLALNVATTRSILLDAPTGDVSMIVKSFGDFVVGGNYLVGFVIFVILVVINFIVITKGAGRVAEVGARFTLDAMPGKQMAIDAELSANMIDQEEAKKRRAYIEHQADFYGAMDGASKFVRGDAIAGIIITAINIVMGLVLGVSTYGLTFVESAQLFTLLTVGDGLVSQIPALIVSTAAGIMVTRTGGKGEDKNLSGNLVSQLLKHPRALVICALLLALMAVVPGLPTIPFLGISVVIGILARRAFSRKGEVAIEDINEEEEQAKEGRADEIEGLLHIDTLALEVGIGLIPLVDAREDGEVLERIISARKQFAQDLGFVVPKVMVRDNIQLKHGEYQILLKGEVIGKASLMWEYLMAMAPGDDVEVMEGIKAKEPAYGLDALWIKPSQKEEASFRGYTVVNCSTVIVTHLTKLIEEHASELVGRQEIQGLIDSLHLEYPKVVEEVVAPDKLQLGDVARVLQNLLEERVSIRDLVTIFETLADHCRNIKHPDTLVRYVRKSLGRGIVRRYLDHEGQLPVIQVDRAIEDILASGIYQREDGSSGLQLEPDILHRIYQSVNDEIQNAMTSGSEPTIVCSSVVRWEFKNMLKAIMPNVVVLANDEIPQGTRVVSVGMISI